MLLILLAAAGLRLYRLDEIPPGLTHDEADTGYFSAAVYRGAPSRVEAPYGYVNQRFSWYSGALFMAFFGPTDRAMRLHSVFFGLLMLLFGYLWARAAFDVPTALGATALAAVSFWPLSTARFALNPQPAPALFAGAAWFLWLALFDERPPHRRWWAWLLFALCLGGSLWAYEVARATAAALVALFAYLLLFDRQRVRQRGAWFAAALALGLALAAPHLLDPAAWQRSGDLATTLHDLAAGNFRPLLATSLEALGTLTVAGDPFITYNVPGRPIYDLPMGLLFYGGTLLCLVRWRRPAGAFTLLWIAAGLLPSMIVGAWNSTLHSMGMQYVVFLPPAYLAVEAGRWLGQRYGRWMPRAAAAAFVLLVALSGWNTCRDYFLRWGEWPQVRAAYFHNLAAITDYLNHRAPGGAVTLSSPFPDLPHDPLIADLRVRRDDLQLGWCDARRGLLFPAADAGLLILPTSAPLDDRLAAWLDLDAAERVVVHPEDVDPYFDVVRWNPADAWSRALGDLDGEAALPLPVDLGAVELVAYRLASPAVAPGETVELVTAWRVRSPDALGPVPAHDYGRTAAIFAHLLGPDGAVVGQEDRLDVPAWNWQAGDRFLQLHRLPVAAGLPPGSYALVVGLYTRHDMQRLAVQTAGGPAGDHVPLQPVEVVAP